MVENSLCVNCKFNTDCSLTPNKSFIWSCNEYELAETKQETPKSPSFETSNNKIVEFV